MKSLAIVKCSDYEYDKVKQAIHLALCQLGGMERFVKKGDRVVIKPNLVIKRKPEEATTTHPAVVEAVIEEVYAAGGIVTIAESPGGLYTASALKAAYELCGLTKVAEKMGAKLNYDTSFAAVSFEKGRTSRAFNVINPLLEADVIINLPKLKTHVLSYMTGAVKNMFGAVPGAYKAEYHFRMKDKKVFCDMLVDLCECVMPTLSIMDAIVGMEGDGPSSGQPRAVGAILAGANPHQLDIAAAHIIGIRPVEVPTLNNAIERGLVNGDVQDLEIYPELASYIVDDFIKPAAKDFNLVGNDTLNKLLNKLVQPKPVVINDKCIGCGECARNCPAHIIDMIDKKPQIDLSKCIRCFCCHELCPIKAMDIKRPLAARLFFDRFV